MQTKETVNRDFAKDTVDKIRKSAGQLEEWNEDFRRDYFRQEVVRKAVEIADRIISEAADGSEELNYFTGRVAEAFTGKVLMSLQAQMFKKDLLAKEG